MAQFGPSGWVEEKLLPISDNGLVFVSSPFTVRVCSYRPTQEFIKPPRCQDAQELCVQLCRFESIRHATRVVGERIYFCNYCRPHSALAMGTSIEAFGLAA